jgi:hypothetical protein
LIFFSDIPPSIQDVIKSITDSQQLFSPSVIVSPNWFHPCDCISFSLPFIECYKVAIAASRASNQKEIQ